MGIKLILTIATTEADTCMVSYLQRHLARVLSSSLFNISTEWLMDKHEDAAVSPAELKKPFYFKILNMLITVIDSVGESLHLWPVWARNIMHLG